MNDLPANQELAELAAWRRGPWVLKSDHDRMVRALKEQLTKALEVIAKNQAEKIKDGRAA